ncbi:hypothetical protein Goshw_009234 [Gossypium schwendimanii]|uniref:Uncharacterized protein n=1 Tax=Gossypium schwendimanii TaxID=34291 RepID=A0A7J9NBV2_GOSSC|nr:hypothetical protein [Gossypium schwendimanii]
MHGFTVVSEDSSRQSLLKSYKSTDLFEEIVEHNRDDTPRYEEGRCLCFEYIRLSYLPQGFRTW